MKRSPNANSLNRPSLGLPTPIRLWMLAPTHFHSLFVRPVEVLSWQSVILMHHLSFSVDNLQYQAQIPSVAAVSARSWVIVSSRFAVTQTTSTLKNSFLITTKTPSNNKLRRWMPLVWPRRQTTHSRQQLQQPMTNNKQAARPITRQRSTHWAQATRRSRVSRNSWQRVCSRTSGGRLILSLCRRLKMNSLGLLLMAKREALLVLASSKKLPLNKGY